MEMRFYILLSLPFVLIFTLCTSVLAGRSGHFKAVLLCSNGTVVFTLLGLVLLYSLGSSVVFGVTLVLLTTNGSVISAVGQEFLAELAFPMPEPLITTYYYLGTSSLLSFWFRFLLL